MHNAGIPKVETKNNALIGTTIAGFCLSSVVESSDIPSGQYAPNLIKSISFDPLFESLKCCVKTSSNEINWTVIPIHVDGNHWGEGIGKIDQEYNFSTRMRCLGQNKGNCR